MSKYNVSAREKVGFALVEALEKSYETWQNKRTESARQRYMTWRLRLRIRWNHDPELLIKLNQETSIGLFDEEPGPLYDDVEHEEVWTGI